MNPLLSIPHVQQFPKKSEPASKSTHVPKPGKIMGIRRNIGRPRKAVRDVRQVKYY